MVGGAGRRSARLSTDTARCSSHRRSHHIIHLSVPLPQPRSRGWGAHLMAARS